jgi:hypothetical protein
MSNEELKTSAMGFGFDASWVADILQNWGDDVLSLAIEAARHGLSVTLVVDILKVFGPSILEFLVEFLNKRSMAMQQQKFGAEVDGIAAPVKGLQAGFIDVIIDKYLPIIFENYLPLVAEKYGPQLIQLLVEMVMRNLKK